VAFPDLRIHRAGMREEGFWPSFTDIMMVIVMIFLMAMLGLLLRNMDLVARLQSALVDAQQASQTIKKTSSANQDLSSRLAQSEHELEMMRAQLMDASSQHQAVEKQLLQAKAIAAQWQQKAAASQEKLQQIQSEKEQQMNQITMLRQQMERNQVAAEQQATLAAQQLQQQGVDIADMRAALAQQSSATKLLRDDYSALEAKYRRLIRPARSSLGKVVITVRYLRRDGKLNIAIQPPDKKGFVDVDSVRLHQILSQWKAKLHHKLYVRILFPEDSGLSYNEAWRITESLLRLYDYYYQN